MIALEKNPDGLPELPTVLEGHSSASHRRKARPPFLQSIDITMHLRRPWNLKIKTESTPSLKTIDNHTTIHTIIGI